MLDIVEQLKRAKPFEVPDSEERLKLKNIPVQLSDGATFYICENLADPHTNISPEDTALHDVIIAIREQLGEPEKVTVKSIIEAIHKEYPPSPTTTTALREYRKGVKAQKLGYYFQPKAEQPIRAMCIHKALLAQAVASTYGLETQLIDFGFDGQFRNGRNDNIPGMHAVIRNKKDSKIADPQKNLYEDEETYFQGYDNFIIFEQGRIIFSPHPEREY
jgi:hypothetical protein